MDQVETIVIGAGVVGLAIAARLAESRDVLVLEQEAEIGQGISSRNSEVIHAGIYYPQGSQKARLCVRGKSLLYDYCQSRQIPYRRTGKLIVATTKAELAELELIQQRAVANGVHDLTHLDASEVAALEPNVRSEAALLSPSTGIVSAHDLMLNLTGDVERRGGSVVTHTRVEEIEFSANDYVVEYTTGGNSYHIRCQQLVIAAGLAAQSLATGFQSPVAEYEVPALHLCRGRYYSYAGAAPFQHLIYPVPEKNTAGLGIHATLDLGGQVKFGPDVEYVDAEDYSVASQVPEHYLAAIAKYFPGVEPAKLTPGYAGIRPKLAGPGEPVADFRIDGQAQHGLKGLTLLFGIESPGLTASLAIAESVEQIL
ncbi:MAG: NAD(P)/FAD-dependent oxidoreductase [Pseudomonadales bacterium]